jgi:uncharacterized protein YcbX
VRITELREYPVKSLGGTTSEALVIEPWGPAGDRRWAVVGAGGAWITARTVPAMLSLQADVLPGGVRLRRPDGGFLEVAFPDPARRVPVGISRLAEAVDAGAEAHTFLSEFLGRDVRLVWQDDPRRRSVSPERGGRTGDTLSLADAGPLLLTTEASLARLQEWIGPEPVISMLRFRPNVVIDGDEPFAEDGWSTVTLGGLGFHVSMPCDRCAVTMIDPVTGARGPEPVRTLARHRRRDGKTWFGVRLVPLATGKLRVGDAVGYSMT